MAEYIKREDAYEILHRMFCDRCGDYTYCEVCDIQRTFNLVKAQPHCDVEAVRHGEWIEGVSLEKCSLCGKKGFPDWWYCPNCGAKMRGGE